MSHPKIITFGTLKGGTGKTNTLVNIAGILAENNKVLIIDCDPQGNATTNLGVDIRDLSRPCVRDIFEEDSEVNSTELILESCVEELPNLYLIPSNFMLTETEMRIFMRTYRENILKNWFEDNSDLVDYFDYILLDTNPSMGLVNQNAFNASDSIILVADMGYNGALGAQVFKYLWEKKAKDLRIESNIKALIINNTDIRMKFAGEIKEYCTTDEDLSDITVLPDIPARALIKKAERGHKPISVWKPNDDICLIYSELINNLKKKGAM